MSQPSAEGRPHLTLSRVPRFLLLMRLPLGDTLFVTPTIRALRERYPSAYITALAAGNNAPILQDNPDLDDVVVLPFRRDRRGGGDLPATLRDLLRRAYDVALCLGTPALGWLPYTCRIPRQEFLDYAPLWWLVPRDYDSWNAKHAVEVYATAARHLDIGPIERQLIARSTPAELAATERLLQQQRLGSGELRIAIHPGSGAAPAQKRWPLERFAEVGRALAREEGARVLVLGGQSELALGRRLAERIGGGAACLAGKLSLRQTLALLAGCDLFIGNDSGPLHLATAAGAPVVGIYGPTDPNVFGPWAPPGQAEVVQPAGVEPTIHFVGGAPIWSQLASTRYPSDALANLPAASVLAAAHRLLERERRAVASGEAAM